VKPRTEVKRVRGRQAEAAILFAVGPHKFAIAASEVDEIRDMHGLTPASLPDGPYAGQKITYVLRRERQTYHVVDASCHFQMNKSQPSRVMVLRGGLAALTADSIDRMSDITAITLLPRAFHGKERQWFRGVALIDNLVVPVVNSHSVIADVQAELARAALAVDGARA
jgi:chemotaxis signal transduction protein